MALIQATIHVYPVGTEYRPHIAPNCLLRQGKQLIDQFHAGSSSPVSESVGGIISIALQIISGKNMAGNFEQLPAALAGIGSAVREQRQAGVCRSPPRVHLLVSYKKICTRT